MHDADLTREQIEALEAKLCPMLRYLVRPCDRRTHTGFVPGDKLRDLVAGAHDAIHRLTVELRYAKCKNVGRASGE